MNEIGRNFEINSLIVFDPSLTNNENEVRKKILYCHPITIPINLQTTTIGLCEAMCNFAREFTDSPCQFIHTMKTRLILHRLENDIWMVMTVNVPKISENVTDKVSKSNHRKHEPDFYQDELIQNSICDSIISHCRQMFFLFMGPPSLIVKNFGIEVLMQKLTKFFNRYIGNGMLDNYYLTDCLTGIHYLSMDNDIFSTVVDLMCNLEVKFPVIIASVLLFNNNMVYSTVVKEELGILYRYLTTTLLAKYNANETMSSVFTLTNMGKFVLVSHEHSVGFQNCNMPKIFLGTNKYLHGDESSIKQCVVLVYKAVQATVVLFVDESTPINEAFYTPIDEYFGPKITEIVKVIMKKTEKLLSECPYKYLYWDSDSLLMKCTLFPTRQFKSDLAPLVPIDSIELMNDIKQELNRDDTIKEMVVKLPTEFWVSAVKNVHRELMVVFNKKNLSLTDVSKEMKQVCNREFPDLFKFDTD